MKMAPVKWILVVSGGMIAGLTYFADFIKGRAELNLGPKSYTVITVGILLVIIGFVFFSKKK